MYIGFKVFYIQFLMAMGIRVGANRNVGKIGNENEKLAWK